MNRSQTGLIITSKTRMNCTGIDIHFDLVAQSLQTGQTTFESSLITDCASRGINVDMISPRVTKAATIFAI